MTETYSVDQNGMATIKKDVLADLDYSFDWTSWLTDNQDALATANCTVNATSGVTLHNQTINGSVVTVWASGGNLNSPATLTCKITTAAGRVDERSICLQIVQR